MIVEKRETGGGELDAIERWPDVLGELHARIARRFQRPEVGERARRYLAGLLGRVERKNGWQTGESGPQGAQRLSNAARRDADAVRDDLRAFFDREDSSPAAASCSPSPQQRRRCHSSLGRCLAASPTPNGLGWSRCCPETDAAASGGGGTTVR